jgi:hypothetical protein
MCQPDKHEYFNSPEGYAAFGAQGDHNMWPPQKTAVEAMRECIRLRDFYAAVGQAVVESMKRGTE